MWKYSLTSLVTILITHDNVTHLCSATVCTITYDQISSLISHLLLLSYTLSSAISFNSIFDLQSCNPDSLLPTVLERTPGDEVDRVNEEDRQLHRIHSLFSIYPIQQVIQGCLYRGYSLWILIAVLGQFCAEVITYMYKKAHLLIQKCSRTCRVTKRMSNAFYQRAVTIIIFAMIFGELASKIENTSPVFSLG